jgi:hypothetical protein
MGGQYEREIFEPPRQKPQRGQPGLIHVILFSPCPFSLDHYISATILLQNGSGRTPIEPLADVTRQSNTKRARVFREQSAYPIEDVRGKLLPT